MEFFDGFFGLGDPDLARKPDDPAVEQRAQLNIDPCAEALGSDRVGFYLLAEAVDDIVHHRRVADKCYLARLPVEHLEQPVDVAFHLARLRAFSRRGLHFVQILDPIDSELPDRLMLFRVTYHIIIVSVVDHLVRGEFVVFSVIGKSGFLVDRVAAQAKSDPVLAADRDEELIYRNQDSLIFRLPGSRIQIVPQLACFVLAYQRLQLPFDLVGLASRKEMRCLERIDKQLHFCQLQPAVSVKVLVALASVADNVKPEIGQLLDIRRQRLARHGNAILQQILRQLLNPRGMVFIGLLPQILQNQQHTVFVFHSPAPPRSHCTTNV